jgi:hypothetical protein
MLVRISRIRVAVAASPAPLGGAGAELGVEFPAVGGADVEDGLVVWCVQAASSVTASVAVSATVAAIPVERRSLRWKRISLP